MGCILHNQSRHALAHVHHFLPLKSSKHRLPNIIFQHSCVTETRIQLKRNTTLALSAPTISTFWANARTAYESQRLLCMALQQHSNPLWTTFLLNKFTNLLFIFVSFGYSFCDYFFFFHSLHSFSLCNLQSRFTP
jgi:hypothetical protein